MHTFRLIIINEVFIEDIDSMMNGPEKIDQNVMEQYQLDIGRV